MEANREQFALARVNSAETSPLRSELEKLMIIPNNITLVNE